jgi:hypothetical protein
MDVGHNKKEGTLMIEGNIEIVIPEECRRLDQNEEWVEMIIDGTAHKVRLHDYGRFYEIHGLYDKFYQNLQVVSPQVVCEALKQQMIRHGEGKKTASDSGFRGRKRTGGGAITSGTGL